MKLPNNYGSISKLSGNRRRPYMVRKSLDGKQLVIGYFETKEKALQALADYNRQPSELPKTSITLTTLYKQWLPHHAPNLSKSGVASYENSYRHIQSIAAIPIQNLTYDDFQGVLDAMQLSYASKKKVRSLINQLCKFAIKKDLMQRNFGDLVTIGKNSKVRPHKPFTRQQGATPRPANNATTATFATSFGGTDYIIVPVGVIDASDNKWSLTVNVLKDYKKADSCTFRTSDSIAPACYYFAAGRLSL